VSDNFRFIPLKFTWVALNPNPQGVVYFIGGAFFGSFPNIFYRYLLKEIFDAGYTIVAIPFRFTFRHWSVSIEIFEALEELREAIYQEAQFRGYTNNIDLYHEKPTSKKFNYLWLGHSLGGKYISLLEILTGLKSEEDLKRVFDKSVNTQQAQDVLKELERLGIDISEISIENQPSLLLAPVIAGLESAIPIPPLVSLLKAIGIDVQPNVEETKRLILSSGLFTLLALIAFFTDTYAGPTVSWFSENLSKRLIKPLITLPKTNHLTPLGWKSGNEILARTAITEIGELRQKLESG
jgi:hypothetical protein